MLCMNVLEGCDRNSVADSEWDYREAYRNRIGEGSQLVAAGIHYSIEQTPSGDYLFRQYYPETGQLLELSSYRDPYLQVRQGSYEMWLDDGTKYVEGHYKNGLKTGEWKEFNLESGKLYRVGSYRRDERVGNWLQFDSAGNRVARVDYNSDSISVKQTYYNNEEERFEGGIYEHGQLNYARSRFSKEGTVSPPFLSSCENSGHRAKCTQQRLLAILKERIDYPPYAKSQDVQGTVIIRVDITDSGKAEGRVIRGVCDAIKEECQKAISRELPPFKPAIKDGRPVRFSFYLPLDFELKDAR